MSMLLEPTIVAFETIEIEERPLVVVRFEPRVCRLHLQLAGVYGTNRSPRDRMRHDY